MEKALNKLLNEEIYSSYLYLSMSAYFESENLPGFANWMLIQYKEEYDHAMKFFHHINERGGRVKLESISKPKGDWNSPMDVINDTLQHEQKITSQINEIVDLAFVSKDHASYNFLQWFVSEQVEEEANVTSIREQLKMIEDSKSALFFLDKELGKRTATPTTQEA